MADIFYKQWILITSKYIFNFNLLDKLKMSIIKFSQALKKIKTKTYQLQK